MLNDSERKSLVTILSELASVGIQKRCIPNHYISRYLYKKDCKNIHDYLPNRFLYNIKSNFNDPNVAEVLENKLFFNFFYGQAGLTIPKVLMYNHHKMFVLGNRSMEIHTTAEFKILLEELLNASGGSLFIKSTYGTYGGDRIYKIEGDILSDNQFVEDLYCQVVTRGYLFQKTILQHPEIDKINHSCINTIRMDTFIDNEGRIEIISGHMRMSIRNSHVDNIGSGGCAVAVSLNTGRLKKFGYVPFKKNSEGKMLVAHPITHTVFEDFEIPYFQEAMALVIKAASLMPGLRLIGWDVGIGIDGPVLIEGNTDYDITGSDLMEGGYRANPVFRKALKEINYL